MLQTRFTVSPFTWHPSPFCFSQPNNWNHPLFTIAKRWKEPNFPSADEYIKCVIHIQWNIAAAKSLQSCPTLCDPIDSSPSGSAVSGILQARTLEWVAIAFSNKGILFSLKKKKMLRHAAAWIALEDIMPREISQSQRTGTVWFHLFLEWSDSQSRVICHGLRRRGYGEERAAVELVQRFSLGRWEFWRWMVGVMMVQQCECTLMSCKCRLKNS